MIFFVFVAPFLIFFSFLEQKTPSAAASGDSRVLCFQFFMGILPHPKKM
jgi:hypothetical protein